ncbi:hypothetical protein jhhlp_006505 [Lomentospora prolificans]|uniref:Uncharacterized protein n=1 Tax=Lomentospora prolificans TaxID=41688 RepID=A0A2N3N661_9PEZI|nr:hypothetical protein jhhlp_006505 [Lomentospora prolificans]
MSSSGTTFSTDPALWIFTSLTAGSSHIVTATSRLETILRANKVPFKAVDIATDEKARMLWGRRAGKDAGGRMRKLPGLVQEGMVLGDLVEIEEWNEYGELKQNVKIYYDDFTIPPISQAPPPPKPAPAVTKAAPAAPPLPKTEPAKEAPMPVPTASSSAAPATVLPIHSIADEAAKKAKEMRLQSLREKVYGKDGAKAKEAGKTDDQGDKKKEVESKTEEKKPETKKEEEEENEEDDEDESEEDDEEDEKETSKRADSLPPLKPTESSSSDASAKPSGLQSPTSAAWKNSNPESLREMIQSPTSTSWKSSHVDPPVTSLHGSLLETASEEEIAAIERREAITEEPDKEDELAKEDEEEERRKSLVSN